jgi:hypothetical protein
MVLQVKDNIMKMKAIENAVNAGMEVLLKAVKII